MTTDLTTALVSAGVLGVCFGFQGSVSPGPLQTILISETLSNGVRSGWRAAFAPVCTDPWALILALFVVANISDFALACVAFGGAALLCRVAWSEFQTKATDFDFQQKKRRSFLSILAINFLNPNLWIFSFAVNAFQVNEFYRANGIWVPVLYLASFWITICACNLGIVFLVGALKSKFDASRLVFVNRVLGVFLIVVAIRFVWLGLTKVGLDFLNFV